MKSSIFAALAMTLMSANVFAGSEGEKKVVKTEVACNCHEVVVVQQRPNLFQKLADFRANQAKIRAEQAQARADRLADEAKRVSTPVVVERVVVLKPVRYLLVPSCCN